MVTHVDVVRDLRIAGRVLAVLAALSLTCAFAARGQRPAAGSPAGAVAAPAAQAGPQGALAGPQGGQAVADAGLLRWYQGAMEIGRETFRREARLFETESQVPMLKLKLRYRSEYDAEGRLVRFEGRLLNIQTDSLIRLYTAVAQGDTLRMRQQGGRPADSSWTRAARADAVTPNQSFAALIELAERAGGRDRTWAVWSPELNDTMVVQTTFRGDTVAMRMGPLTMTATRGPSGRVERLDIPAQRVHAERWNGRDSLPALQGARRPASDYVAPPGAPYSATEVRVPVRPAAGDTFSLGCTLTLPTTGPAPFPAAVTITGSGLQDRDENLWPLVPAFRPFRQVAERLARVGIAVLRCDDRSLGASTGDASRATSAEFADDTRAQVAWLRGRSDIAGDRHALIGHSEGGIIAPMEAAEDARLAAAVLMAGTAKNGILVVKDQIVWSIQGDRGVSEEQKARVIAEQVAALERDTTAGGAWVRWFRTYDPLATARRVRQPVLILQGALDRQVSAGQADSLGAAIRAGGNRDVTVRVFPRLNHLFVPSPTDGSWSEYPTLTDPSVSAEVLDTMAAWLAQRLRRGR